MSSEPLEVIIQEYANLQVKFESLQAISARAFVEFKDLKQKYTDISEENEALTQMLSETKTKLSATETGFQRLKEVSKKATLEFNEIKQKLTEETERRTLVEEEYQTLQSKLDQNDRSNMQTAALMEEVKNLQARLDREEKSHQEFRKKVEAKDSAQRSKIEQLQTEVEKERQKRMQVEKEMEIKIKKYHTMSQSIAGKSLDDLLSDLERKLHDEKPSIVKSVNHPDIRPLTPTEKSPPSSSPSSFLRPRTPPLPAPKPIIPITDVPTPPPGPPKIHPQEYYVKSSRSNSGSDRQKVGSASPPSNIIQAIQGGVKLKKVDTPEPKPKSRPISIHNKGAMGELGSLLSASVCYPSLRDSTANVTTESNTNGRKTELNDLFQQLEQSLGI